MNIYGLFITIRIPGAYRHLVQCANSRATSDNSLPHMNTRRTQCSEESMHFVNHLIAYTSYIQCAIQRFEEFCDIVAKDD